MSTADLAAARSRHDVARLLLDQARHRFAADIGAVLPPDHGDLEVVGHFGFEIEDEAALRRVMSRAGARPAIEEGRSVDVATDSRRGSLLQELAGGLNVAGLEAVSFRPLSDGSRTVAVLALGWARGDDVVDDAESSEALLLLAAQGFERARLGDVDHLIASTLQNEFLRVPTPARLYGISWSARYRAGLAGTRAGGDWFDVIDLGHGVDAAGQMAQLRSAARALAGPDPGRLLEGLDRFVDKAHAGRYASVAYVVIDTGQEELHYAVAGHPPPVLHTPDGETCLLDRASGIVLGADDPLAERDTARRSLPAGSRLVLYTDGLVERRGESIDDGLRRLGSAVVAGPGLTSPDELADALMLKLTLDAPTDDVALMVVGLDTWPSVEMVVPSDAVQLAAIRSRLRVWLADLPFSSEDCDDIVLGVSEAAANAMEHGARLSSELLNTVSAWVEDSSLVVTVRDVGTWVGESTSDRGRGLMIMQAVFDTVDVDSSETGTVVTMSRRLPAPS